MSKQENKPSAPVREPSVGAIARKRVFDGRKMLYRMVLSALFLATALVVKTFGSLNIPIFGAGGMRVGLTGVFTAFPAFLFGPIYGGVVSGLSDLIGYIIKPEGAYIPWLTVMAFVGGLVKGALWKYVIKSSKAFRIASASLLLVCAIVGGAFHVALIGDGVQPGLIAVKEQLPTRGQVEQMELSPLSSAAVSLAKYNKDNFTLQKVASNASEIAVPAEIDLDGLVTPITKIGEDAFGGCMSLRRLYIGSHVTSVDAAAFSSLIQAGNDLTVTVVEGSKADAQVSAMKGIHVIRMEQSAFDTAVHNANLDPETLTVTAPTATVYDVSGRNGAVYTVKNSDTYRKYLAGYVNFLTVGLESVAIAGLIVVLVDGLIEQKRRLQGKESGGAFLRIFASIGISGVLVTLVNTEILRLTVMSAWVGRSFLILAVPRVLEEIIVCALQAYVISLLYGVYVSKVKPKIPMLREV